MEPSLTGTALERALKNINPNGTVAGQQDILSAKSNTSIIPSGSTQGTGGVYTDLQGNTYTPTNDIRTNYAVTPFKSQYTQPSAETKTTISTDPDQATLDTATLEQKTNSDAMTKAQQDFSDAVTGWRLSPSEQAQVDALRQKYDKFIQDQEIINAGASGTANIRGYQTGAAEYDPMFQAKTIGSIMTAGADKVRSLQMEADAKVGELTEALKDNDIKRIKTVYDSLTALQKEKATQTQKTIDDTNKRIQTAQADQQKVTDSIEDIAKDAAKNGADAQTVNRIMASTNVNDAINFAGDYLQTGSGIIGEYQLYKRDMQSRGLVPLSFNDYQTQDANRKAKVAAAGTVAGYTPTTVTKIQQVSGQFDNEPSVKNYQTVAEQVYNVRSLDDSPTDDIQRVYAFAKVADPGSAVREGEYKTVQDYATALWQRAGLKAERVFTNTGFLTEEARKFMLDTLNKRLATQEKAYNNVYNEYARRINKLSGGTDGADFLTDYSKGYGGADKVPKTEVENYVKANPNVQIGGKPAVDFIADMAATPGATPEKIYEWLVKNKYIKNI